VLKHLTLQINYEKKAKTYRNYLNINREAVKFPSAEMFKERLDCHGFSPSQYPLEEMA